MRERQRRLYELKPVIFERQALEEGRASREWMDRRAEVVQEARKGELGRSGASAERLLSLQDEHRAACASNLDRSGEAVRPRTDDDRVPSAFSHPRLL